MIIEDIVIGMLIGMNDPEGMIVVILETEEGEITGTETLNPGVLTMIVKRHLRPHLHRGMRNQQTMIVKRRLHLRLLLGMRSQ